MYRLHFLLRLSTFDSLLRLLHYAISVHEDFTNTCEDETHSGPGKQTKIQEYIAPSQVDKPTPTEGQEARLRRRKPLPRENHFTDDSDSSEYVSKIKLEEGKTNRKHKSPVKSRVKARARVLSSVKTVHLLEMRAMMFARPFKRRRLIPDSFRPASKVKESENGKHASSRQHPQILVVLSLSNVGACQNHNLLHNNPLRGR
ncbi:uncharacterized protein EI90DRAFT_3018835 [Cantharellus anzutake]|uniref:uncharacterized protein n=1 Tax=Cantharellus anzutake TaxID=1750568 RepID=UPI001904EB3D|nr:uncharacterized protein EI90DRAFT_3018835 [Cantharellus anzutake]KAF8326126.1 hypothetical protein EI90DRAFT_3018835 [Cantharellus anzutake]